MIRFRPLLCFLLCSVLLLGTAASAEDLEVEDLVFNEDGTIAETEEPDGTDSSEGRSARESFIDDIIALGEELYIKADGKLQRA